VWAAVKRSRKRWGITYCGTTDQLKRVSRLPAPAGDRSQTKYWKEAIWHRRKRYNLPEIEEVRTIWQDYMRLAKDV